MGKPYRNISGVRLFFRRVTPRTRFFYILKGKIKLTAVSTRGKEPRSGSFFYEGCLNGHTLRVTTATAIEECVITRITKAAMIATMIATLVHKLFCDRLFW
jgi:CRP/FNR family transcriptional regulator, cyclic AMP receptor protein